MQDAGESDQNSTGPITTHKSGSVMIQILAKPGAKENGITGTVYFLSLSGTYINEVTNSGQEWYTVYITIVPPNTSTSG